MKKETLIEYGVPIDADTMVEPHDVTELELEPEFTGSAYEDGTAPRVPATLREAQQLWLSSEVASSAFVADVVGHYANMAQVELAAFDAAVTDWDLRRGFERM